MVEAILKITEKPRDLPSSHSMTREPRPIERRVETPRPIEAARQDEMKRRELGLPSESPRMSSSNQGRRHSPLDLNLGSNRLTSRFLLNQLNFIPPKKVIILPKRIDRPQLLRKETQPNRFISALRSVVSTLMSPLNASKSIIEPMNQQELIRSKPMGLVGLLVLQIVRQIRQMVLQVLDKKLTDRQARKQEEKELLKIEIERTITAKQLRHQSMSAEAPRIAA